MSAITFVAWVLWNQLERSALFAQSIPRTRISASTEAIAGLARASVTHCAASSTPSHPIG